MMKNSLIHLSRKQNIYILLIFCLFFGSCARKKLSNISTAAAQGKSTYGTECISVDIPSMNVFYIGVDNPIKIKVPKVNPKTINITIKGAGGTVKYVSDYEYAVRVTRPTPKNEPCVITISGEGFNTTKEFQVKRIPDPVAKLNNSFGGSIGAGQFTSQEGIEAVIERFEYEVKCEILGFILTRISKKQKDLQSVNRGPKFTEDTRQLIDKAKPGDLYTFDKVKARCPGDVAGRSINSMFFNIK